MDRKGWIQKLPEDVKTHIYDLLEKGIDESYDVKGPQLRTFKQVTIHKTICAIGLIPDRKANKVHLKLYLHPCDIVHNNNDVLIGVGEREWLKSSPK